MQICEGLAAVSANLNAVVELTMGTKEAQRHIPVLKTVKKTQRRRLRRPSKLQADRFAEAKDKDEKLHTRRRNRRASSGIFAQKRNYRGVGFF
ncbi:hypothetical protein U1Q18_013283 [Sarracenia purpurea var. burkii]